MYILKNFWFLPSSSNKTFKVRGTSIVIIIRPTKKKICFSSPPSSFFEDSSKFFLFFKLSFITCSKRCFRSGNLVYSLANVYDNHFQRVLWSLEGSTSQNKKIKRASFFFSHFILHAKYAKYRALYRQISSIQSYFPIKNKK